MRRLCPRCQERFPADIERCPSDDTPLWDDPFIGSRIGQWTLTDFVGQGAMGVVYAAEPTAAVKILHARRVAMQPGLVQRFETEARAAMRLQSRYIARVFDSGTTDDGHLFIAMELLRGEPLDAILERSPRLAPAAAATIAYQIALALREAHGAQIVHRDLKPANVFVEPAASGGRHVRVLDFGVARINSESVARSRTGSVAGTPAYMSPEQLRGEPDIDGRSDIYSLGVLLYRLLAGFNPFRGPGGVLATLRRHLELRPPPIERIPPALDHLVRELLAKPREARPQTMERVQQLLALTGLVDSGADMQTIPGMSREALLAAGVYDVAPDPESQPPVRRFVQRSDQTPATATATATAGQSPPLASESEMASGPITPLVDEPIGAAAGHPWLGIAALMAVGVVLGLLIFRFVGTPEAINPSHHQLLPSPVIDPSPPEPSELSRLLDRAEAASAAERWDEARRLFDRALAGSRDDPTARAGRDRAGREAINERRWEALSQAARDEEWSRALAATQSFPPDSVYAVRAEALRATIEAGYTRERVAEARGHISAGRLDAAAEVQSDLDVNLFAREEAEILAREIAAARRRPPAAPTPGADADFETLMHRALTRLTRGDERAAIGLLQKAARRRPRSALPYQRLCVAYEKQGRYVNALASCRKWLETEPNSSHHPTIERRLARLKRLAGSD